MNTCDTKTYPPICMTNQIKIRCYLCLLKCQLHPPAIFLHREFDDKLKMLEHCQQSQQIRSNILRIDDKKCKPNILPRKVIE